MEGTFWAFVPAIVAIALALVTKQVYLSLFVGIFVGAMFYTAGNPLASLETIFNVMSEKIDVPIIVFLVVLGIIVILMQKSGGSKAYGDWMSKKIKTKKGALTATAGLGCLIFVDDYFNCLTVGSVMRPLTDKFNVSHSKLSWIIDSTAAPVCIIAPISSWAAAVSGLLDGDAFFTFIKTIPFNIYAILTIIMVFVFCALKIDFGKMKKHEKIAEETGDLNAGSTDLPTEDMKDIKINENPKVKYLIIPVVLLILSCFGCMIYNGWSYLSSLSEVELVKAIGKNTFNFTDIIANCTAGTSLAVGSTITLIIISIYYIIDKSISFKDIMESIPQGFKAMVPAILILCFAWTISGIMGPKYLELESGEMIPQYLNARGFVEKALNGVNLDWAFPAIFFILACGIAFATGTSWGTFGMLIPLATAILGKEVNTITLLTISATMGGAVFGDHVSPISDTTIMSSTGANCNHLNHVSTQLPYAGLVAIVSAITYLVGGLCYKTGFGLTVLIIWAVALVLFAGIVFLMKYIEKKQNVKTE